MRVIAGKLKGRRLKAVSGYSTRPTADKVKEALFQIIGPYFNGGKCLDLYAGSGSLGIEAISRGMAESIFVDKHPKAVHTIRDNLQSLQIEQHAEVFCTEAMRGVNGVAKRGLRFDLILLDPPYGKMDYSKLFHQLISLQLLNEGGFVYCEHDASQSMPEYDCLSKIKQKYYGRTTGITIYQKQ
ncbi:MAG TPA: 16S rRNA (guanine(966)-N(2))-methyltransferase RsmD [Bacillota bacterium]|nr:16S rRNA (guanine(966)-N(2))-methyltransferase RsmD [Bacillota bacterium]